MFSRINQHRIWSVYSHISTLTTMKSLKKFFSKFKKFFLKLIKRKSDDLANSQGADPSQSDDPAGSQSAAPSNNNDPASPQGAAPSNNGDPADSQSTASNNNGDPATPQVNDPSQNDDDPADSQSTASSNNDDGFSFFNTFTSTVGMIKSVTEVIDLPILSTAIRGLSKVLESIKVCSSCMYLYSCIMCKL